MRYKIIRFPYPGNRSTRGFRFDPKNQGSLHNMQKRPEPFSDPDLFLSDNRRGFRAGAAPAAELISDEESRHGTSTSQPFSP